MARREEETTGDRRIVREYDDAGKLARVRVEPLPPRAFRIVAVEPAGAPKDAPAPPPPPPPPPAPAPLVVADLESKVDALLARPDRPVRAKKRAPLPVPQFAPLAREPWEDRLDKALGKS